MVGQFSWTSSLFSLFVMLTVGYCEISLNLFVRRTLFVWQLGLKYIYAVTSQASCWDTRGSR